QDGHRPAVLRAEHALDLRRGQGRHAGGQPPGRAWNGRTSIGSRPIARANLRPHSSAASRSGASTIVNPPRGSLPSTYGPSVTRPSPALTRSTVAVLAGCRPPEKPPAPAAFISVVTASTSRMIGSSRSRGGGSPSGWYMLIRYCVIGGSSRTWPPARRRLLILYTNAVAPDRHPAAAAGRGELVRPTS